MLIQNSIFRLDYNPSTDVLQTRMPDFTQMALAEVNYYLELIVDSIRNYDIKNLLLDSSHTLIDVDDESYKAINTRFAIDLASTHLKKIARIRNVEVILEDKATKLASELSQELHFPISYRTFTNQDEAMLWLIAL